MKKLFVTYDIALKLRELGFDEPCYCWFHTVDKELSPLGMTNSDVIESMVNHEKIKPRGVKAPLWQQAQDWFRIKHGLSSEISTVRPNVYRYYIVSEDNVWEGFKEVGESGYEKSRIDCLEKLIEIVDEKRRKNP